MPPFCFPKRNLVYSLSMKKHPHGEDIDFEPEETSEDADAAAMKVRKLKEELEKVRKEKQEYLNGWQRCKADSVNARKEALQAAEKAGGRAKEALMEEIIPVLDAFDIAAKKHRAAFFVIDGNSDR